MTSQEEIWYFALRMIDEVKIWNRALGQNEIQSNFSNRCIAGNQNGLVGYWTFNELSGLQFSIGLQMEIMGH